MTNYKHLKQEEKELVNSFKTFLKNVLFFFEKQYKSFILKGNAEEMLDESIDMDKKYSSECRDILDDCIWFIQKNEPRANHLRLIVALINSLNDIKRISNYAVTLCRFYNKCINDINDDTFKIVKNIGTLTLNTVKQLLQIIEEFNWDSNTKKKSKDIFDNYIEKYKATYYSSIKTTIQNKNVDSVKFIANSVVVIKNFDRTVDHIMNIVENLLNI